MRYKVSVDAEWATTTTFEFDSEEEAEEFREIVNRGNSTSLDAIVDNETAELESHNAELINFSAGKVKEGR